MDSRGPSVPPPMQRQAALPLPHLGRTHIRGLDPPGLLLVPLPCLSDSKDGVVQRPHQHPRCWAAYAPKSTGLDLEPLSASAFAQRAGLVPQAGTFSTESHGGRAGAEQWLIPCPSLPITSPVPRPQKTSTPKHHT